MSEPPPIPVQPLSYQDVGSDAWNAVIRAVAVAAIALGILQLAYSAAQVAPAFMQSGPNRMSFGFPADLRRPMALVIVAIEIIDDAAAIGLIAAGATLLARAGSARTLLVVCAATFAAMGVIQAICRLMEIVTSAARSWPAYFSAVYSTMTLTSAVRALILPSLMIYLVLRDPTRPRRDQW